MSLKQIFETRKNFKLKTYKNKYVDQVDHYNFCINYVNFYGCLEILNLNFKIYELRTHIWDSK
jgi:hypothetical protein